MSCPSCFEGTVHEEKPTGHETTLHGRDTYVAKPPSDVVPKGIIIIIPDAYGWTFVNNRLLADQYARKGHFTVYLPDFMDGRPAPLWLITVFPEVFSIDSLWSWCTKPYYVACALYGFIPFIIVNSFGRSMPKVRDFFSAVRSHEASSLPLGAAGFCWGGKFSVELAHGLEVDGQPLVDACFTAHPSGLALPDDIDKVKKPLSIAVGDKDFVMTVDMAKQVQSIFKKREDMRSELVLYPGAGHGFGVRADPKNGKQAEQAAQAEDQAINWFTSLFKDVSF